jgi:hypothetical protein
VAPAAHRSGPVKGPLEQVSPRSRAHAPSSGFRLARGPTPPRAGSASLKGQHLPRAGYALLEGQHLPGAGSASLEGQRLPQAGSASLEGSPPPRSRLPHKRTYSRARVRAFNALTQQSRAITRLGITPRRCSANSLGETHPRHYRELCGMAGVSSMTLFRPLPYGQHAAPSKGGRLHPQTLPS